MIYRYRVLPLLLGAVILPVFFLPLTPVDPFLVPKQVLFSFIACISFITLFYPVESLLRDSSKTILISSLFFLSCIAISIPASTNQQAGISELMRWAYLLIIFFTARRVDWSMNRLRRLVKLSLIISAIVSISTLLEYFELVPFYIYPFDKGRRIYSFFGYPNIMAQYLIVTIFWGFGLVLSSETNKTRGIALICTILSFAALLVTFSRGSIISTILGGLLFSYLYIKIKRFNNISKRKVKSILALFIIALFIGIFISDKATDGKTFIQIIDMFKRTDSYRLMLWIKAVNAFSLNPILGIGLGNYRLDWHIYVHNEILQMLVETGIIGLSGFLFFLFFVFKKIQQQYVSIHSVERKMLYLGILTGSFATLMHSMVSFNLHSATSSFFFFLGLGILCAVNVANKQNKLLPRNTIVKNVIALMIVVSISLWAIYGEYRTIMSHYYFSEALVSEKQEETFQSLDYILKAIQYQPYNSEYHSIAGRIYWKTDQRELANKYLKKADILSLHK